MRAYTPCDTSHPGRRSFTTSYADRMAGRISVVVMRFLSPRAGSTSVDSTSAGDGHIPLGRTGAQAVETRSKDSGSHDIFALLSMRHPSGARDSHRNGSRSFR